MLLPPIVLGTGPILLNAAENDDKIELSKIVPSRFSDVDTKVTTTLELADVVRRTANLGASYPDIVAILETAHRQKNLPGQLVVDAVPRSNRDYLQAIMGKDVTGKRDDAVKRTSASSRSNRRWFFGMFGRSTDSPGQKRSGFEFHQTCNSRIPATKRQQAQNRVTRATQNTTFRNN